MEKKINVAELLKDCPKGMQLDCTMYEGVRLLEVEIGVQYPIKALLPNGHRVSFTESGEFNYKDCAKCVIFPKGETTWEGFHRPFKDGDIVFYNDTIAIFKEWGDETLFRTYVVTYFCGSVVDIKVPLFGKSIRREARLATEEETQKLFDAIKAKGYKWNAESKTLEKCI